MSISNLLEQNKAFKLVCAAGNQDIEEVKNLVAIYAKAGCSFFDISADENVLKAALEGLKRVVPNENLDEYYFCVSLGTSKDMHLQKARIDKELCINCGCCYLACEQKAIKIETGYSVEKKKCIGCGRCLDVCTSRAISYAYSKKDISNIITPFFKKHVSVIELHAMDKNDLEVEKLWSEISKNFDGILSLSLGRKYLGDDAIIARIKKLIKNRLPYTTLIQADGTPMSGGKNTYNSTLQAVSCADLIQKSNLPVYILISGGTNSKTAELARKCGVSFNGVSVGSYARKIVRKYTEQDNLLEDSENFKKAVIIAKELIDKNL